MTAPARAAVWFVPSGPPLAATDYWRCGPHWPCETGPSVAALNKQCDFLGYTFGPYRYRKDGHWYLGTGPSKKSVSRVRQKIGAVLKPRNVQPWGEVRDQLNRVLRGWAACFGQGMRLMAYRAVDHHVYTRVRLFLIRRHKVPRRGAGRYPDSEVFGTLGVLRLRSLHLSSLS